jgi:uncharacterized membrane protein YdjX (TVP38/TMEM64 family)
MTDASPSPKRGFSLVRLLPILLLAAGLAAFFLLGLNKYIDLNTLKQNREVLTAWVAANPIVAPLVFIGIYIAVAAFSLPIATLVSITGGFLFGAIWGTIWIVIGASIGGTLVFLAVKFGLSDALAARAGEAVKRMEQGFRENAFSYLLFLRLVPIFPFFLVNIVAGLLGVSLSTFFIATIVGIIPGAFVYAGVGNGLGAIFDAGGSPDLGIIFKTEVLLPILGLALLSLVPLVYRLFFAKKSV